jgi:PelA/Pel-15E family pectate lyase
MSFGPHEFTLAPGAEARYWYNHLRITIAACLLLLSAARGGAQPAVAWADVLAQPASWYATPAARAIADSVLRYQRESGGWPKDVDMTRPPRGPSQRSPADATIDNGATTTQIRLLARIAAAAAGANGEAYRDGAIRGIEYLLHAQYPNGGWPQVYPLRKDYTRHITFNDNAMVGVLNVLDDVGKGNLPFGFVDEDRKHRAREAVDRGVQVILKTQVSVGGTLTAWCAQHDEVTLAPRAARAYEHVSLSGSETVGIVRFLMDRPMTPEVVRAVEAAVAWLRQVRLPDGRWARFYELDTNRPMFSGRDGIVRYRLDEIEPERRDGYAWFGTWPRRLLDRDYPAWRKKVVSPADR